MKQAVELLAAAIEGRIGEIEKSMLAIAVQLKEIEQRQAVIRKLLDAWHDSCS